MCISIDNRCGLIRDSADYRYMCGLVPNDILHGHYRSMSDSISGIPYFKTIARRDDFFWPSKEENEDTCERITENGVTKLIAHSSGPRKKTIIRGKIYIPEDTVITFGSDYGVCGQLSYYDDYGKTAIVKRLY